MSTLLPEVKESALTAAAERSTAASPARAIGETAPVSPDTKLRARTLAAVPIALIIAFAVHVWTGTKQPANETQLYTNFLGAVFALTLLASALQIVCNPLRAWMRQM